MHSNVIRMLTITACIIGTVSLTYAQQSIPAGQTIDTGKDDYNSHCASCHGVSGAGDGPNARLVNMTVPNLTTLSKRNGGKFPYSQVLGIIDGRFELPAHGTRNMPIWGQEFIYKANPRNPRPEEFARAKINALVLYVSRLQAK